MSYPTATVNSFGDKAAKGYKLVKVRGKGSVRSKGSVRPGSFISPSKYGSTLISNLSASNMYCIRICLTFTAE